jgi:hypothetical protein
MTRRNWFWILLAACGCRRTATRLPETLDGGWKLVRSQAFSAEQAPKKIRDKGLKGGLRAAYQRGDTVTVSLYEMKAPASAFALAQGWGPESKKMAFFHGNYFGLAESPDAERPTLQAFISALEKALK